MDRVTLPASPRHQKPAPRPLRRQLLWAVVCFAAVTLSAYALICILQCPLEPAIAGARDDGRRHAATASNDFEKIAPPENSGWLLFVPQKRLDGVSNKWASTLERRQDSALESDTHVLMGLALEEDVSERPAKEGADVAVAKRNDSTNISSIEQHISSLSSGRQQTQEQQQRHSSELINKSPSTSATTPAGSGRVERKESFKNVDSLEQNQSTTTAATRPLGRSKRRAGASVSERGKPILNEFFFPANLVQGMRFVLMCQVLDGEPPIQIKWFKDNMDLSALLQLAQENKLSGNTVGSSFGPSNAQQNQNFLDQVEMISNDELGSSLLIRKVKQQHSGNYTCLATNHFGTSSYSSLMTVKVPSSWRVEPQDHESIMGEHIRIDCQASGNPNPFIRWKFTSVQHDKIAPSAADRFASESLQSAHPDGESSILQPSSFKLINSNHHVQTLENGSLTIRQAGPEHEGLYLCEADNGVEPSLTKQVRLVVHRQAHFIDDIQVISSQQQAGADLAANAGTRFSQQSQEQAQLAAGPSMMQSSPTSQVVLIKSIKLPQNSSLVRLVCSPRGDPPLQLDWLKDGRLIHTHSSAGAEPIDHEPKSSALFAASSPSSASSEQHSSQTIGRYHVNTRLLGAANQASKFASGQPRSGTTSEANGLESELLLTNLARHEAGLYTCAARNAYGQAERKLRLIVQEQPEPPSMVDVAHIASRSISLRWLTPFDGNSPIVKYVIEYRKLPTAPQDPAAFNGQSNSAELEAANASGYPVGRSEKLMPVIPSSLKQSLGAALTSGPDLSFGVGSLDQSVGLQQQQQQLLQLTTGAGQIQHAVHDLEPMTRYSMRVLAFNALGASRPSVSLILRTEEEVPATVASLVEASVLSSKAIKLRWTISYSLEHELIEGFFIGYRSFDSSLGALNPLGPSTGPEATSNRPSGAEPKLEQPTFTYKTIRLTNQQQQDPADQSLQHHHQTTPLVAPISSVTRNVQADSLARGAKTFGGFKGPLQQDVPYVISSFEHVIGGLERNTEYTFMIQCFNKKGAGPASDPVVAKTLSADPPEKLLLTANLAEDLPETSLRVQWRFLGESRPDSAPPPIYATNAQEAIDGFVLTFARVSPRQQSSQLIASSGQQQQRQPDMAARISQPNMTSQQFSPPMQPSQLLDHQWQAVQLAPQQRSHVLKNLECGTWYAMKIWAFNKIGKGEPSDLITTTTRGKAPVAPDRRSFLTINSTQVRLHLGAWYDGGCEIEKFSVQYRAKGQDEWILVSSNIPKEQGSVLIRDLALATAYELLVGAQNHVGQTEAKYRFSTLDAEGKPVIVSRSFLSGNLPTMGDDEDETNPSWDNSESVAPMRDFFGHKSNYTDGSFGSRSLSLLKQVLNSPLTLLLAFSMFLILLVLLVFHRLNAIPSGSATDEFGPSSSSTLNSSSNKSGSTNNHCGLNGISARRKCSLDGNATMIDGEPAMSMTNGSSLTESPARALNNTAARLNSTNLMSSTYSPSNCYSGSDCLADQQAAHLRQPVGGAPLGNHLVQAGAPSSCAIGNYGTTRHQHAQHMDYYSPSIYATMHRSATLDNSPHPVNTEAAPNQTHQGDLPARQQYCVLYNLL